MNGTTWTQVAMGAGSGARTTITFKPTQTKFVFVTETATTPSQAPAIGKAAPAMTGPAALPPEEQGLPG